MWLSLVERGVRDAEVAGSSPVTPTKNNPIGFCLSGCFYSAVNESKLLFAKANNKVGDSRQLMIAEIITPTKVQSPVTPTKNNPIGFCLSGCFYSAVNESKLLFAKANKKVGDSRQLVIAEITTPTKVQSPVTPTNKKEGKCPSFWFYRIQRFPFRNSILKLLERYDIIILYYQNTISDSRKVYYETDCCICHRKMDADPFRSQRLSCQAYQIF